MSGIKNLLSVIDAHQAVSGLSDKRLSDRAFKDSKRIGEIRHKGAGITLFRYERILQWFSDHWPEGAVWPSQIERPEPTPAPCVISDRAA